MNCQAFASRYIEEFYQAMTAMDKVPFESFCQVMLKAYEEEKTIFVLGNGGSAATASHGMCDINKGVCLELDKKFRMISLCDNIPTITAIANDLDYSMIFVEQLKNLLSPGDILLAISGSGNSENIIKAVSYAHKSGNTVVGISGFDGGRLAEKSHIHIHIPVHDMQKVEDGQMMVLHMLMQSLRQILGLRLC
ncbi:SIS domain-containing protein [Desulfobotulus sp. H1]|uniref:SIS domain-containing protein n=1 Tax=Desulfobotulus pelophilus TaxID=2823377 RepID=A0ABT3N889_9BACT|nr:SIS domain-containing protein [Desulfobotulus pelophilus]MCW7753667.1 SIS domain-containing protein [Desulfobotulus pelophilus]